MVAVAIAALYARTRRKSVGFAALRPNRSDNFAMTMPPTRLRYENGYEYLIYAIKILLPLAIGTLAVVLRSLSSILPAIMVNGRNMRETLASAPLSCGTQR
jgi:hypothetical protein